MRNKTLISLTLGAMILGMPCAVAATDPQQQYEVAGTRGEQTELIPVGEVPSAETPAVQASQMTRKAIQAEKARNAAENDRFGGAITIIAMTIVLSALAILSVLFMVFGKISSSFQKSRKRKLHGVGETVARQDHHDEDDTGEAIAAIAMALAEHFGQGHDMENTILTIRRMRKAYSPWNSKIYNLRAVPAHAQNKPRDLK